ncbi:MAG: AsmA-like C-terminal domain-containing protein [Nitrospira sp.]|nr:AsmA-like C-terminal domain-containing protein [Nitrospira sp.]
MFSLRVAALIVLALCASLIAFLTFSKHLTGEDYLKGFVLEQLETNLGRKIHVDDVTFALFPRARVELSRVTVYDPGSDQVLLTAKRVDLVVRMFPLLRKQIVGKRLSIEEPVFTLRRDEAGRWNIVDGFNEQTEVDQRTMEAVFRTFSVQEASLTNGTVTVIDEAGSDGVRSLKLERVGATLVVHPEQRAAEVRLSLVQPEEQGGAAISLNGSIRLSETRAPLADADETAQVAPFQFDGRLEAAALGIRDIADFLGPRPVPEQLQGTVALHGAVHVMPGVVGYDVLLSEMSVQLNDMTLTGKANVSGLMTAQPAFAMTFSSSPVLLSQLMQTVPAAWIDPRLPAVLNERRVDGRVQVMNATLTGAATEGMRPSISGEFHVQDAQGMIGQDRVLAKNIACRVFVEPGRVRASGITGLYGEMELTDGKATLSFLEAGPWLELEIAGKTSASHLMDILETTVKAESLTRMLADVRDAEGVVEPTFRLAGSPARPDGVRFTGGEVLVRAVSFAHPALPERLTGLQGRFVLAGGVVRLEQISGHLGETLIEVQGTMTGGESSLLENFSIRAGGPAADMTRLLGGKASPGSMEGRLVATAMLTGSASTPHLRGAVVFDQSKVAVPGLGEKPIGAPAIIEFEGDVTKSGDLSVSRLELIAPPIQVPAKGRLVFGESFSIDMSLTTGTLSLSRLPEWISKGGLEAGSAEIALDVKGKGTDWSAWRVTGWVALTNGLATVRGIGGDGRLQDLYARVKLVRNGAEIKRLSFTVLDSDVAIEAAVKNWASKPVIVGKIESSRMDLGLLVPQGDRSVVREFLENLAATSQVTMSASIARGHYERVRFAALSARVNIQDGVVDVDRISGASNAGQIAGRLVVQLPRGAPAEVEASFRATGLPVDDVLSLTDAQDAHGITGDMRVSGSLRGHGRNPHGVYPSLEGKVEVLLQNGRIFKSNERVIWKIISLLNLPAVLQGKVDLEKEGLPYNTITGSVAVKNGVLEMGNLIIDSPILKITAVGQYDLPTDRLNLVAAVSPFGSYSQFLKAIPLFGRIFAGERKGLATAIFAIKGSIHSPEVTYLPIKSFASGLSGLAQLAVDVLVNSLTVPLDLIVPDQPDQEEPQPNFERESAPARS